MNSMKRITLLLVALTSALFSQPADSLLQLDPLIQKALTANPQLSALQNSWQADEAKIPQAGALPDPTLSFNLLNLPVENFVFDQEAMTGKQIALMQMFPFPGKLGLREKIARDGATVSQLRLEEYKNQLVKEVKSVYYSLFFVDRAIETVEKNTVLVREFVHIAETKYAVGKGIQQDVLKAQVELSKMEDKLITLKQKREAQEARLNALLNRPPDQPVGRPVEPPAKTIGQDLGQLQNLADENRPLLKAWLITEKQSDKKVRLAKKDYLPDFRLGVAYTQRDVLQTGMGGADFVSGLVTLNVPVYFWKKQRKKVEETRYNLGMVRDRYRDVRNHVFSGLEKTITDVQKDYRLLDLYKNGIIPQASQSLNSAISGYQTDKVDFLTMLNNQMTLFNYELDYYRILSDYHTRIAELEALTGVKF